MATINGLEIFLLLLVILVFLAFLISWTSSKIESPQIDPDEEDNEAAAAAAATRTVPHGDGTTGNTAAATAESSSRPVRPLPVQVRKLINTERYQYYDTLFARHGNQLVLTARHIMTPAAHQDPDEDEGEENEDASLYLVLDTVWTTVKTRTSIFVDKALRRESIAATKEAVQTTRQQRASLATTTTPANTTTPLEASKAPSTRQHLKQKSRRTSSLILVEKPNSSSTRTSMTNQEQEPEPEYKQYKVEGSCVICFDEFEIGDTIVYSAATPSCHHVYHKECMVEYLTGRKLFKKQLKTKDLLDPPCPTCRSTFCTLLPILDDEAVGFVDYDDAGDGAGRTPDPEEGNTSTSTTTTIATAVSTNGTTTVAAEDERTTTTTTTVAHNPNPNRHTIGGAGTTSTERWQRVLRAFGSTAQL